MELIYLACEVVFTTLKRILPFLIISFPIAVVVTKKCFQRNQFDE